MRTVTLKELHDWVRKNEHRTWSHNRESIEKKRILEIKYLDFSLDTRDMRVWSVQTRSFNYVQVHINEKNLAYDGCETILDGLELALEKGRPNE